MTRKVLLIEDDDALRLSLTQTIELAGLEPLATASFVQARRSIRSNFAGVILSDIRMPRQDGFDVLRFARTVDEALPVILLTGHSDVPTAMRAMKEGAWDYLEKPCGTERLVEVLGRALEHRDVVLKSRAIERALKRGDAAARHFPGASALSESFRDELRRIAGSGNHAHFHGEPGAGKNLAAYTVHRLAEAPRPLLQVNLRGAAPTAFRALVVPAEPADLAVKAIDEASPSQLRELGDLLGRNPALRLLSTAPAPLSALMPSVLLGDAAIAERIEEVRVPGLDERREDLPEIFDLLLRQSAHGLDADLPDLPESALAEIMTRAWPGNLPELRAHAMSLVLGRQVQADPGAGQTLAEQLDAFEKLVLSETLKRTGGRASVAAEALGLARNTFYDRLARYGLTPRDFRPDRD